MKYFLISLIILTVVWLELGLWTMWQADQNYALGKNYDSVQQYVAAYPLLGASVNSNPGEPTFRDELAYNQAVIAAALFAQKSATSSALALAEEAVANSDQVVETSPNSLPFWKSRVKTFYQLGTIDAKYNLTGLEAIKRAADLAPTDAKVWYTYGLLLQRNGQKEEAKKIFLKTLQLKPDYTEVKDALKTL